MQARELGWRGASDRLGASAVAASDEFFAPKERLLKLEAPAWREGEYTDRGKWMDGWETRRRRDVMPGDPVFGTLRKPMPDRSRKTRS